MTMPVPPPSRSPLTQLTISPRTCVPMMMIASLHPQRRRRNHPIPAAARAMPSSRKRIPIRQPRGASCWYAVGLSFHRRSESCAWPEQCKCGEARHDGAKEQEDTHRGDENPGTDRKFTNHFSSCDRFNRTPVYVLNCFYHLTSSTRRFLVRPASSSLEASGA